MPSLGVKRTRKKFSIMDNRCSNLEQFQVPIDMISIVENAKMTLKGITYIIHI